MAINWKLLYPPFAKKLTIFLELIAQKGLAVEGTCGYRSPEEQAELYALGRTKPGKIVTKAKPGQSAHQWGCAVDFIWKRDLDGDGDRERTYEGDWDAFKKCVEQAGLVWGGNFPKLVDRLHVEFPDWKKVRAQNWHPPKR